MINLEKGSERKALRETNGQEECRTTARKFRVSNKETERTKIYNLEGINSNLIQCEKIQIQGETEELAQIHTHIYM